MILRQLPQAGFPKVLREPHGPEYFDAMIALKHVSAHFVYSVAGTSNDALAKVLNSSKRLHLGLNRFDKPASLTTSATARLQTSTQGLFCGIS